MTEDDATKKEKKKKRKHILAVVKVSVPSVDFL